MAEPNNSRFSKVDDPASQTATQTKSEVSVLEHALGGFGERPTDKTARESLTWTGEKEVPTSKEEKAPKKEEKTQPIAGTFKDQAALEKAYKELQKAFTQKSQIAARASKTEAELQQLNEAYQRLQQQVKPVVPNAQEFNTALSIDPAVAIREEIARQRSFDETKQLERQQKDRIVQLQTQIHSNIASMEAEYPEFISNKAKFGEWMTYYGMDSTSIMADPIKAAHAYRDFIDANSDPVGVAKEQVLEEMAEKARQAPGYDSTGIIAAGKEQNRPSNQRFVRIDEGEKAGNPENVSALDKIESHLGVGPQNRMF